MMPFDSPGNPTPVAWPSPNRARYVASAAEPNRSATLTAPMLLDSATMSPSVICIGGCGWESWIT